MTSEAISKLISFVCAFAIACILPAAESAADISTDTIDTIRGTSSEVDLLQYMRSSIVSLDEISIPKYSRDRDFGGWINTTPGNGCFNTRYKVLARDADPSVPLVIEEKQPGFCRITTGLWHDPYTGQDRTESKTVQIDHVVALRNAYYSGAHSWRYARRCHYANYLENNYHLLPVDGDENEAKLDYTPERYMPPNKQFHCRFLSIWMRTKAIWNLKTTASEVTAIERLAAENHCSLDDLRMPASELQSQRALSAQPTQGCVQAEEMKAQGVEVPLPPVNDEPTEFNFEKKKAIP